MAEDDSNARVAKCVSMKRGRAIANSIVLMEVMKAVGVVRIVRTVHLYAMLF